MERSTGHLCQLCNDILSLDSIHHQQHHSQVDSSEEIQNRELQEEASRIYPLSRYHHLQYRAHRHTEHICREQSYHDGNQADAQHDMAHDCCNRFVAHTT